MGTAKSIDPRASELFSSARVAEILNRTPFCIWYHSTRNLKPVWVNKRIYLTKKQMRKLVEDHLRLKADETTESLLQAVEDATPEPHEASA